VTDQPTSDIADKREQQEREYVPVGRSWGALALAVVEAVCVFAVGAAQTGILAGSLAVGTSGIANFIHREIFRVPILLAAMAMAALNLYLLWNSRMLRNAPAAAWRKRPLTSRERFRIGLVLGLSLATFAIAACEIVLHRRLHHTIM
jgi:hypothetical protein